MKPAQASGHGPSTQNVILSARERAEEQASEHAGRAKRVDEKEIFL